MKKVIYSKPWKKIPKPPEFIDELQNQRGEKNL